jgi:hypothetical protein
MPCTGHKLTHDRTTPGDLAKLVVDEESEAGPGTHEGDVRLPSASSPTPSLLSVVFNPSSMSKLWYCPDRSWWLSRLRRLATQGVVSRAARNDLRRQQWTGCRVRTHDVPRGRRRARPRGSRSSSQAFIQLTVARPRGGYGSSDHRFFRSELNPFSFNGLSALKNRANRRRVKPGVDTVAPGGLTTAPIS